MLLKQLKCKIVMRNDMRRIRRAIIYIRLGCGMIDFPGSVVPEDDIRILQRIQIDGAPVGVI